MVQTRKVKDCGPLHGLLLRACPPSLPMGDGTYKIVEPNTEGAVQSIAALAAHLSMSAWGVQKWCKANRVPPVKARMIVDMNPGEVTLADFSPYIYF